ncbi:MAG: hypothetical protein WAV02_22755 [Stellaceae bacterium]
MSGVDDSAFDWDEAGTTIALQPRTSVYWNVRGQVVIRQEGEVFEDDPYVFFSVESLPRLIEELQWRLIESGHFNETTDTPEGATAAEVQRRAGMARRSTSPMTNAERQRRYKQRQKKGNGTGNENAVTEPEFSLPAAAE